MQDLAVEDLEPIRLHRQRQRAFGSRKKQIELALFSAESCAVGDAEEPTLSGKPAAGLTSNEPPIAQTKRSAEEW